MLESQTGMADREGRAGLGHRWFLLGKDTGAAARPPPPAALSLPGSCSPSPRHGTRLRCHRGPGRHMSGPGGRAGAERAGHPAPLRSSASSAPPQLLPTRGSGLEAAASVGLADLGCCHHPPGTPQSGQGPSLDRTSQGERQRWEGGGSGSGGGSAVYSGTGDSLQCQLQPWAGRCSLSVARGWHQSLHPLGDQPAGMGSWDEANAAWGSMGSLSWGPIWSPLCN